MILSDSNTFFHAVDKTFVVRGLCQLIYRNVVRITWSYILSSFYGWSARSFASFLVCDRSIPGEDPGRHTLQPMNMRNALRNERLKNPYRKGFRDELIYPSHKNISHTTTSVLYSINGSTMLTVKKGIQKIRKTPMMIPKVFAAFLSLFIVFRCRCFLLESLPTPAAIWLSMALICLACRLAALKIFQ